MGNLTSMLESLTQPPTAGPQCASPLDPACSLRTNSSQHNKTKSQGFDSSPIWGAQLQGSVLVGVADG
jgi:hypothetical protein